MKIQFITESKMTRVNKHRLSQINTVIEDYAAQGYKLTLRQLYYQLVTKNIISNNDKEYAKLGNLVTKGRLLGIIDWNAIEDRVRVPRHVYEVEGIDHAISDASAIYRLDRMKGQNNYIELWVEKDALSSVLSRKTRYYHIRLMVNRGYSSTTAMYDAYERFVEIMAKGKKANVLYLGDHDPSGLDMIRDIRMRILRMLLAQPRGIVEWFLDNVTEDMEDKLREVQMAYDQEFPEDDYGMYIENNYSDALRFYIFTHFDIKHIALTSEQVRLYNPPPNPAKLKDPRSKWYLQNFGRTSWEVDALNPVTLHEIIDTNVMSLIDKEKFEQCIQQEIEDKAVLGNIPKVRREYGKILVENRKLSLEKEKLVDELDEYSGKVADIKEIIYNDPLFNQKSVAKGDTTQSLQSLQKIKDVIDE